MIFADGYCPECGCMTHNYGSDTMECPNCGWSTSICTDIKIAEEIFEELFNEKPIEG